jgi:hypothetical protein
LPRTTWSTWWKRPKIVTAVAAINSQRRRLVRDDQSSLDLLLMAPRRTVAHDDKDYGREEKNSHK